MKLPELDLPQVLGAASAFGLVVALWTIVMVVLARRRVARERVLRERLDFAAGQTATPRTLRLWHDGREETTTVPGQDRKPSLPERVRQLGIDAGWTTPAERVLTLVFFCAGFAGLAAGFWLRNPVGGLSVAGGILIIFWWTTSKQIVKRAQIFERQLVDALELSSRALRVGHSLVGSLKLIAEEVPAPVGTIFKEIVQQQDLGARPDDSLMRAAELSKSQDLRLFATSLAINMRAGGNLADVMEGLAFVIRERMRLGRRFRVLAAQSQMSKRILLVMPVLMFFVMNLLNPEYMKVFYGTGVGAIMLLTAAFSMFLGWFVMHRMSAMRY